MGQPTTACFEEALNWLLQDEGIFSDHPLDRGGITQFGITQSAWADYSGKPATLQVMQALTRADAADFYDGVYWLPLGLAGWERAAAIATLNMAVLQGASTTMQMAQRALGVAPDGIPGKNTLAAASGPDSRGFVLRFVPLVMDRFARICREKPEQTAFLRGWTRRAMRLLDLVES